LYQGEITDQIYLRGIGNDDYIKATEATYTIHPDSTFTLYRYLQSKLLSDDRTMINVIYSVTNKLYSSGSDQFISQNTKIYKTIVGDTSKVFIADGDDNTKLFVPQSEGYLIYSVNDTLYEYIYNNSSVSKLTYGMNPRFTPDGKKFLFQKKDNDLWAFDLKNSTEKELLQDNENILGYTFTHDQTNVIYFTYSEMILYNVQNGTKKILRTHATGYPGIYWTRPVILNKQDDILFLQFRELYSDGC
ncbi:MAG TPA: hypothetical protein VKA08_04630, partial [Balneolales bacterium]|nr:hypothetical protein [Balneolales bacterium]